jgi:hypothetical protein
MSETLADLLLAPSGGPHFAKDCPVFGNFCKLFAWERIFDRSQKWL